MELAFLQSYCLSNPEDYTIRGSFDQINSTVFQWQFDKCSGDGCKSDVEISQFVANMAAAVFYNHQLYRLDEYGEHVT